ncbi:hypothetical protein AU468_05275 [Alkalispirochaeta sphaeroplastigenens]|uniref:Alginate export domain-containing protein n=1 Tax=Alkalispirochaeta sphaeroplastigenens TaxID=1187066 RepID=A0A2S4JVQ6_9SPIO|nr:hypothetical protein [Alkalispirochaeta sphaeroplastigenens]POR03573.1 hypothetical protein AU468_05275 [Alkalispirochaeta sphaeroplastigenens]
MKKQLLVLVVIVAMVVPMTAMAVNVTWGGSMTVEYANEATDFMSDNKRSSYIEQTVTLSALFDLGQDVSLFTEIELYDGIWEGDTNPEYEGENFLLRQAYVDVPLFGGSLKAGRIEANWADGLTTHENLRDRLWYTYEMDNVLGGPLWLIGVWDIRNAFGGNYKSELIANPLYDPTDPSSPEFISNPNYDGDRLRTPTKKEGTLGGADMWNVIVMGYNMRHSMLWGWNVAMWTGEYANGLDRVGYIGPILQMPVGPVELDFGAHTLYAFDDKKSPAFHDFNFATYLRTKIDLAALTNLQPKQVVLESQVFYNHNNSLIDDFDTWSSVVGRGGAGVLGGFGGGSDPSKAADHDPTGAFIYGLNPRWTGEFHRFLFATRATVELIPGLNLIPAAGVLHVTEDDAKTFSGAKVQESFTDFFVDLGVTYEITQRAQLYADFGIWFGDDDSYIIEDDKLMRMGIGVEITF